MMAVNWWSMGLTFFWLVGMLASLRGQQLENPSLAHVQRTMGRMAASTPENPATVRWLFYGQSITAQKWTAEVQQVLQHRFPSVRFVFENPAIGGFQSPDLLRTAAHDLYPWYPDLLVFHVYGPLNEFETLLQRTRARTTAEIVLWTSHLSSEETLDKDPDKEPRIAGIRALARRYECHLIDVRKKWINHLKKTGLKPSAFLRDGIHLNEKGNALLASFMVEEWMAKPEVKTTPLAGEVRWVPSASSEVDQRVSGQWTLDFEGNRVVVVSNGQDDAPTEVLIDGQSRHLNPDSWAVSRPGAAPDIWMPAIKQVGFEKTPVEEAWTLTCLPGSAADGTRIRFRVDGSVTGLDGEGFSDRRFVSRSGRVVIEPQDWHLEWCLGYRKMKLPDLFKIRWKTYPLFSRGIARDHSGTESV
ncbi:MAG: SGNH/GDSL hydrolase family protein, partial [Verrucomicrobiota bacterium]